MIQLCLQIPPDSIQILTPQDRLLLFLLWGQPLDCLRLLRQLIDPLDLFSSISLILLSRHGLA